MIKYGIIGAGNCGGQIVALAAEKMKIDGIAINTCDQDLNEVRSDTVKTYLIGDKKGTGQKRSEAKKFLKSDIRQITESEDFKLFISSLELIYIVSSTGGGTGSGISPLLYHLVSQMTKAPVVLIGIVPTIGEGRGVQMNSATYLDEIYNTLQGTRYMLYDNNKPSTTSTTEMMTSVNEAVVHDIKVLSGFYNHATRYASIDDKDILTIIKPAGRIVVGSVDSIKEKDLDQMSIEDRLIQNLKTNYHVESDRDGICANTGIITNLSQKLNDSLDTNIPKIHEFVGEPKNTAFKHISVCGPDEPNFAYFIASGLSPVNDRIQKIADRIEELDEAEKDLPAASALSSITLDRDDEEEAPDIDKVDVNESFKLFGI